MADKVIRIDNISEYNRSLGMETRHPLVTVVDLAKAAPGSIAPEATYMYGVYALFLKNSYCGDITYGRQPYDYQEGTVASYAPGQTIHVKGRPGTKHNSVGLLFHPDLIVGTELGRTISNYRFFSYAVNEALHLSEEERGIFLDCLGNISTELQHSIDNHSRGLICRNIQLLLDYCMRFYERQFITRENVNRDVLVRFERLLDEYFDGRNAQLKGLPSVKYFAENCFLSPNYFGDLVKKETGRTPQEYIQQKVVALAKDRLAASDAPVGEVAESLGFLYSQHFNRFFKRNVGQTPSEYRRSLS